MNRAQRRLAAHQNRPAFRFVSELGMRGVNRAFQEQLRTQMTEEANGKPIDPDVLAKMTRPKETDDLYQVMVTVRGSGRKVALGPMMSQQACGQMIEGVNRQILSGQRRDWSLAEIVPMTRVAA